MHNKLAQIPCELRFSLGIGRRGLVARILKTKTILGFLSFRRDGDVRYEEDLQPEEDE